MSESIKIDEIFVECACGGEGIKFEYFRETEEALGVKFPNELWISMWSQGFNGSTNRIPLRQKLKLVFQLLKTGSLYTDMVILQEEGVQKLKKWLNEKVDV